MGERIDSLALLTDLYEINMAASYFEEGWDQESVFELSVRGLPKNRGFLMVAGLEQSLGYLQDLRFDGQDIDYLQDTQQYTDGFLDHLAKLRFTGDVMAMPEGTIAFAYEPLLQIRAPIIQAQLVETFLLNNTTFQTMVATKAARTVMAANGKPVVDFSARRDHGIDASLKAARASFLAGCVGTSNVMAAKLWGIPAMGTMAHSYVLAHKDELSAFRTYAKAFPDSTVLLIDTYDIRQGTDHAVTVAKELQKKGHNLKGVRIDSGDLAKESTMVRKILDEEGIQDVQILCSGNLDEFKIQELEKSDSPISSYGVGTAMGTSDDAPTLNTIYKLVEQTVDGKRQGVLKLSQDKGSLPMAKQVFRLSDGKNSHDVIGLEGETIEGDALLRQVMKDGKLIAPPPPLDDARRQAIRNMGKLDRALLWLDRPKSHQVAISQGLQKVTDDIRARMNKAGP